MTDILITGETEEINKTKNLLKKRFNITDIGHADTIIGIKFEKLKDGYLLHQRRHLNNLFKKYNLDKFKIATNMVPETNEEYRKKPFDETKYRQAIGSLLYLGICTRPDILFYVSKASRKSHNPNYEDWLNVIKIFRYLKGKPNYGLKFTRNCELNVFVDADFGGDLETRKSTTGYLIMMGNGPTTWYSKLQKCISVSTAESEFYSLDECAKHCMWYQNLFEELGMHYDCINIHVDNKAVIYLCENEIVSPKTRHMAIKMYHVKEQVKSGKIKLKYIESKNNLADGFTKYLNKNLMDKFRESILFEY